MQTTYLSMGSNIGDRQYYLHEAIRLLGKHPKIMIEKVSNFYEIQVKLFTNFSTLQKVYVVNNLLKNEQDSIEHNIDR